MELPETPTIFCDDGCLKLTFDHAKPRSPEDISVSWRMDDAQCCDDCAVMLQGPVVFAGSEDKMAVLYNNVL